MLRRDGLTLDPEWQVYRRDLFPPRGTCRRRAAIRRWRCLRCRFFPPGVGFLLAVRVTTTSPPRAQER
jgi:hypothetical protein